MEEAKKLQEDVAVGKLKKDRFKLETELALAPTAPAL